MDNFLDEQEELYATQEIFCSHFQAGIYIYHHKHQIQTIEMKENRHYSFVNAVVLTHNMSNTRLYKIIISTSYLRTKTANQHKKLFVLGSSRSSDICLHNQLYLSYY